MKLKRVKKIILEKKFPMIYLFWFNLLISLLYEFSYLFFFMSFVSYGVCCLLSLIFHRYVLSLWKLENWKLFLRIVNRKARVRSSIWIFLQRNKQWPESILLVRHHIHVRHVSVNIRSRSTGMQRRTTVHEKISVRSAFYPCHRNTNPQQSNI